VRRDKIAVLLHQHQPGFEVLVNCVHGRRRRALGEGLDVEISRWIHSTQGAMRFRTALGLVQGRSHATRPFLRRTRVYDRHEGYPRSLREHRFRSCGGGLSICGWHTGGRLLRQGALEITQGLGAADPCRGAMRAARLACWAAGRACRNAGWQS